MDLLLYFSFLTSYWYSKNCLLIFILIFLFSPSATQAKLTSDDNQYGSIVVEDVTTDVDISTQIVKLKHKILFTPSVTSRSFFYNVHPSLINNVANITTTTTSRMDVDLLKKYHNNGVWEILFEKPLREGKLQGIQVICVLTHVLKSFPSQVTQHEKHLVLYSGPISLYSPYLILKHTSYINIGEGVLETVSPPPDFTLVHKQPLTFVSHNNIPLKQYVNSNVKIHFQHMNVFLTVKMLLRTIEVSHWGSIAVTETIEIENSGAKFYGPFHREYPNNNNNKDATSVKVIDTFLPSSATDIFVYDDIGVISSIKLMDRADFIHMVYEPRFLLYGGWKIKYNLNYKVPSYEYLRNKGDKFILKMRTIDHIFNDMVIDKAIIKIILPEGSEKNNLRTPYPVEYLNQSFHISYLDTIGRPVITFMAENLVEDHIRNFVLRYTFSKFKMLFEPFYVILFLELAFILIIIFNRIDFSITKDNENETDKMDSGSSTAVVKVISSNSRFKKKRHST